MYIPTLSKVILILWCDESQVEARTTLLREERGGSCWNGWRGGSERVFNILIYEKIRSIGYSSLHGSEREFPLSDPPSPTTWYFAPVSSRCIVSRTSTGGSS